MRPNLLIKSTSLQEYTPISNMMSLLIPTLLSKPSDISPTMGENSLLPQELPKVELADIFRKYGEDFLRTNKLSPQQYKVMHAILHCRTKALGSHVDICDECGHIEIAYNSCRNRHCPKCQSIARRKWVQARLDDLLPISYFHTVFTLPHYIFPLSLYNKEIFYELLFNSAAQTLLDFGNDPKHLGAKIGFYGILHTWGGALWQHLHVHFIVTAGGLSGNGEWIEPKYKDKFLFPVRALSKTFRGKFVEGLKSAYYNGKLTLPDELSKLADADKFEKWIDQLVGRNWVVYSKPPFSGPEDVVRYIGRYTHRVAISNSRLISIDNGEIHFLYKDYKDKKEYWKETSLSACEFIRRFMMHVLPPQFHRIRHYGLLANGKSKINIKQIRQLLASRLESSFESVEKKSKEEFEGITCPVCKKGHMIPILIIYAYKMIALKNFSLLFFNKKFYDTS